MAKEAIALIVAGTGTTNDQEVFDLLEDAYPADNYEEIGLIVPVDKDMFSDTVKNAVKWFDSPKDVIPVQTKGASIGGRAASALGEGNQVVEKFADILDPAEFEDWDAVHFLVAMPDDIDSPEYDTYAELVEVALDNGFEVKDLTKALDDVELRDPEEEEPEAEPEPEPEPEKPARRSRRKASEPEPEEPEADPVVEATEDLPPATKRTRKKVEVEEDPIEDPVTGTTEEEVFVNALSEEDQASIQQALEALSDVVRAMEKWDEAIALFDGAEVKHRPLTVKARVAVEALASVGKDKTPTTKPEDEDSTPAKGRGRPRTNFEVKQIWDDETSEWVPRPKGRMRKGTEWRTIHAETNEVLEEGTA